MIQAVTARTVTPQAVTFDFWNTLVREDGGVLRDRRLAAWVGILEDEGFACERQQLSVAFDSAWQRFLDSWHVGDQFTAVDSAAHIVEQLGYDLPPDIHERLVATYEEVVSEGHLELTPNVADTLHTLRRAGIRLGIICDVGMTPSTTLRRVLEREGVLDCFDHWSFSDEVGFYKPAREIFDHALAGLGVAAVQAAHIGDLRRTDVAGARAMGITSLRYTGVFDDDSDGPEADHVVADHAELPAILGL